MYSIHLMYDVIYLLEMHFKRYILQIKNDKNLNTLLYKIVTLGFTMIIHIRDIHCLHEILDIY